MKLKCIGGPLDGYRYDVKDYQIKYNELVQLPKPISELAANFDPNKIPEVLEVPYFIYKVSSFTFSSKNKYDVYHFLIPHDWSNREAMLHQFGK